MFGENGRLDGGDAMSAIIRAIGLSHVFSILLSATTIDPESPSVES